jgi:hypothetical protein
MRIHGVMLRDEMAVEAYQGDGAYGPRYATGRTIRCRVDQRRRIVRDTNGNETVSESTVWCRPTDSIAPEDRVTLPDGTVSRVLTVKHHRGLSAPVSTEVTLT